MGAFTWHDRSPKEVMDALHSRSSGLTQEEVNERRQEGSNKLPESKAKSRLSILAAQFASPFMVILLFAAVVSFFLQEWVDVAVIAIAILVNSLLGYVEEYRADQSLQALKSYLPVEARVRRDGKVQTIEAKDIVVGDLVLLQAGDKVTADGRLVSGQGLEVNEAALTGESTSVKKRLRAVAIGAGLGDQVSMVFAGTQVVAGKAEVLVTAIGQATQLGKISGLVNEVEEKETPLQKQLSRFARRLGLFLVGISVMVFFIGLARGFELVEMFYLAVALAVAAVPEGLVVAVTVVLAIGMQRILKKQALVRHLVAAETLGSVEVICMDKTGTLTTGEMAVAKIFDAKGKVMGAKTVLPFLGRMDDVTKQMNEQGEEELSGTPTAQALHRFLVEHGGEVERERVLGEIPFSSKWKYSARLHAETGGALLSVLGAPDVLLPLVHGSDRMKQALLAEIERLTEAGYRVLFAAQRSMKLQKTLTGADIIDLEPIAFIALEDPLREDSARTVKAARKAGLFPVMITGDHPETARRIAENIGLLKKGEQVLTGAELEALTDEQLTERIPKTQVFARAIPEHKMRIIRAWQGHGKSVAMTGDGVNDAPALKAAEIGIALGSGTSVAQETSDMVLLDNRFATIIDAIKEGRILFDNLRKMVVYLLTGTFSEMILVTGALLLGLPLPLLPAQILWINLITDGLPGVALAFEEGEPGVMQEPPRKKRTPVINKEMRAIIVGAAFVTNVVLFSLYLYLLRDGVAIEEIRTFIFMGLGLSSLTYVFAVRRLRSGAFSGNPLKNKVLIGSIFLGLGLQFLPVLLPSLRSLFGLTVLHPFEWIILAGLAIVNFFLIEIVKWVMNRGKR
jgi:Ca2+-transporting ATPase